MEPSQLSQLEELLEKADARLINPIGPGGVHYELINLLGQMGIRTMSRESAIKEARKLLYGDDDLDYYKEMAEYY